MVETVFREWGNGDADMITAITEKRLARASGELADHALEIMLSLEKSSLAQGRIELESTCRRPEAMPLGLDDGEVELKEC